MPTVICTAVLLFGQQCHFWTAVPLFGQQCYFFGQQCRLFRQQCYFLDSSATRAFSPFAVPARNIPSNHEATHITEQKVFNLVHKKHTCILLHTPSKEHTHFLRSDFHPTSNLCLHTHTHTYGHTHSFTHTHTHAPTYASTLICTHGHAFRNAHT